MKIKFSLKNTRQGEETRMYGFLSRPSAPLHWIQLYNLSHLSDQEPTLWMKKYSNFNNPKLWISVHNPH